MKVKLPTTFFLMLPTLFILLLITIFPFIFSIYMSLTNYSLRMVIGDEKFIGLENYAYLLFSDTDLRHSLTVVTPIYVIATLGAEFFLGLGLALLLNRELKGIRIIRSVFFIPMMITPVVTAILMGYIFNAQFGIIGYFYELLTGIPSPSWLGDIHYALITVILVDIWQWTPFMLLILLAGLQSLPKEPFEASEIDGASKWSQFRYITLPLLRPPILIALIIRTIGSLNIFDNIYFLTRGGPGSVTMVISYYIFKVAFGYLRIGYGMAIAFIILILTIIIARIYIKYIYPEAL